MTAEIIKPIDYVAALGWAILGIAFVKAVIYPRNVKFNVSKWISENIKDVIVGILACPIIMQLGAIILSAVRYYTGVDTTAIEKMLEENHLSPMQLTLLLSMFIQWRLYKNYVKKNTYFARSEDNNTGSHPDPDKEEK